MHAEYHRPWFCANILIELNFYLIGQVRTVLATLVGQGLMVHGLTSALGWHHAAGQKHRGVAGGHRMVKDSAIRSVLRPRASPAHIGHKFSLVTPLVLSRAGVRAGGGNACAAP